MIVSIIITIIISSSSSSSSSSDENDENDENHQAVVYSQIDPNGCKSVSIDWEVSYDTLLDAASATMLIVLSLISKNL